MIHNQCKTEWRYARWPVIVKVFSEHQQSDSKVIIQIFLSHKWKQYMCIHQHTRMTDNTFWSTSFPCLCASSCMHDTFCCCSKIYCYKLSFQGFRLKHSHSHSHLFNSLGRLSSDWENIEVAAVKVGSRHGSVIPVLAENPNHPQEQSAVVMCGQSLKTSPAQRQPAFH